MFIYNYTGFQYNVAKATFDLGMLPKTNALANEMKKNCDGNHWIITKYNDGNDSIGLHFDKTVNWDKDSSFHVVKYGAARRFQIVLNNAEETVLFDMKLPAGTSITCDMFANSVTKHGVPKTNEEVGVSGSIVSRSIRTVMYLDKYMQKCTQCEKQKAKRKREHTNSMNKKQRR